MIKLIQVTLLTVLALGAFAANSILCRFALGDDSIDAVTFTSVRLLSGVITLVLLVGFKGLDADKVKSGWIAGFALFLYATTFSFAYVTLETGTGALILFGSVQITMIGISLFNGERPGPTEWLGIAVAFGGLVFLNLPGISAPSLTGFILMMVAGISWGVYTLKGKGSITPLVDTRDNFVRTIPFVLVLFLIFGWDNHWSLFGILLAITSGALASGLGYAIWYKALRDLSGTQAAVLQLSVPAIAALGGVLLLAENFNVRLLVAMTMILGGILIVLVSQRFIGR